MKSVIVNALPKVMDFLRVLRFPPTGKVDRGGGLDNTGPQYLAHAVVVTVPVWRAKKNKHSKQSFTTIFKISAF